MLLPERGWISCQLLWAWCKKDWRSQEVKKVNSSRHVKWNADHCKDGCRYFYSSCFHWLDRSSSASKLRQLERNPTLIITPFCAFLCYGRSRHFQLEEARERGPYDTCWGLCRVTTPERMWHTCSPWSGSFMPPALCSDVCQAGQESHTSFSCYIHLFMGHRDHIAKIWLSSGLSTMAGTSSTNVAPSMSWKN